MIRSPAGFDGGDRIKRYLDYYQPSYGVMMLSAGQFSPASLFAAGAQGAWYDPSDFSTMFQDRAGTTPVTAVEQPVGLILDKSKGLVLGSELVTNPGPFSVTTGWAGLNGASLSISGNKLRFTGNNTIPFPKAYFTLSTVVGRVYKLTGVAAYVSGTATNVYLTKADNTAWTTNAAYSLGSQMVEINFTATATTTYVAIQADSANNVVDITSISVKDIAGNHASQSTPTSCPIFKQDGNGKYYLFFDGVNDGLSTASIDFSSTNEISVFAGLRKLSDAAFSCLYELSAAAFSNVGTFNSLVSFDGSVGSGAYYGASSRGAGALRTATTAATFAAPQTAVQTQTSDISGDSIVLRINGTQAATSSADQGAGNYGNYPLYIGRRGGSTLPYNGNIYSLIVLGALASSSQIISTEAWVNSKTGAY